MEFTLVSDYAEFYSS